MKTNELKKGTLVLLRNGWQARLEDNLKGNTRMATVYGWHTEMGSIYAHDMQFVLNADGSKTRIEHTPAQIKLRNTVERVFA